jgi:hypothetical protein
MSIGPGVKQHGLCPNAAGLMQPINQMPFMVGLAKIDIKIQCLRLIVQAARDIVQRVSAVNLRFARAEQVEVRAVQDENDGAISQGDTRSSSCVGRADIPI